MQRYIFKLVFKVFITIIFIVLLFYILMTANGFKYDFKVRDIRKTSVIYLDNKLEADIYLDGEKVGDYMPVKLPGIIPGEYTLKIEKDGFYPWTRKLLVEENFIERVDDILLIPYDIEESYMKIQDLDQEDVSYFELDDGYLYSYGEQIKRVILDSTGIGDFQKYEDQKDENMLVGNYNVYVNSYRIYIFDNFRSKLYSSIAFGGQKIDTIDLLPGFEKLIKVKLQEDQYFRIYLLEDGSFKLVEDQLIDYEDGYLLRNNGEVKKISKDGKLQYVGRILGLDSFFGQYGQSKSLMFERNGKIIITDYQLDQIRTLNLENINDLEIVKDQIFFIKENAELGVINFEKLAI
ncbi:PEGA domain-containing protein [Candidatus Peregrinibacteria bacterium]|nr:PEGA domain-containing protein [Candidatus Peregrinibacteria bacterium]